MLMNGDPYYAPVRAELAKALSAASGREVPPEWMDCVALGCHVRTAAPIRLREDAGRLAARLSEGGPGELLGAPLVERIGHNGGHLLFTLTPAFFTAAARLAVESLPPPAPLWGVPGESAYAAVRMGMLARKPWAPCPADPAVRMALWRAMGIPERLSEPGPLRLRLSEAARALLTMTHHVPPRDRTALIDRCGGVGAAAARLLSLGIHQLQGGEPL